MRCFALPEINLTEPVLINAERSAVHLWLKAHSNSQSLITQQLTQRQQLSLAQLVPLLLCGEQSAVHVFHNEQQRLQQIISVDCAMPDTKTAPLQNTVAQTQQSAQLNLQKIEADERLHEQALQFLLAQLPQHPLQHKSKRIAQQFYAKIQQPGQSIAEHFQSIALLDSCVCILMNAVAKSSIRDSAITELFHLIKKDEAKHVAIARKYSELLCQQSGDSKAFADTRKVPELLVKMLESQAAAFENLGIDSRDLFVKLLDCNCYQRHRESR